MKVGVARLLSIPKTNADAACFARPAPRNSQDQQIAWSPSSVRSVLFRRLYLPSVRRRIRLRTRFSKMNGLHAWVTRSAKAGNSISRTNTRPAEGNGVLSMTRFVNRRISWAFCHAPCRQARTDSGEIWSTVWKRIMRNLLECQVTEEPSEPQRRGENWLQISGP